MLTSNDIQTSNHVKTKVNIVMRLVYSFLKCHLTHKRWDERSSFGLRLVGCFKINPACKFCCIAHISLIIHDFVIKLYF